MNGQSAERWLVVVAAAAVGVAAAAARPGTLAGQTPEAGPCGTGPVSLVNALQDADVAFLGLVDSVEDMDIGAGTGSVTVAKLRVAAAFSPDVGPTVTVYSCCVYGVDFHADDLYYVFASREADGNLHTDACMGTFSVSDPPASDARDNELWAWPTPVWTDEGVIQQWTPQPRPYANWTAVPTTEAEATETAWLALATAEVGRRTEEAYWPTEDWSAYPGHQDGPSEAYQIVPQPTVYSVEGGGGGGWASGPSGERAGQQAQPPEPTNRRPPYVTLSVLLALAVAAGLAWWLVRSAR